MYNTVLEYDNMQMMVIKSTLKRHSVSVIENTTQLKFSLAGIDQDTDLKWQLLAYVSVMKN